MASAVGPKNVVFRGIEDKWRGPLPCSSGELVAGVLAALLLALLTNAIVGGVAGFALVAALVAWRRLDHDRSDYFSVFFRRRLRSEGAYNVNEPDLRFVPFDPR